MKLFIMPLSLKKCTYFWICDMIYIIPSRDNER